MRNIGTFAFAGILLLGVSGTAALALYNPAQSQSPGQEHHRHPMDVDSQLAHLTKTLDLSTDQQSKIRPLLVDHQQKEQALHQDQSVPQEQLRTKAHAISDETHKQIEALLTDEQKQKMKAMQERRRRHDQNGQPGTSTRPSHAQPTYDPTASIAR